MGKLSELADKVEALADWLKRQGSIFIHWPFVWIAAALRAKDASNGQ